MLLFKPDVLPEVESKPITEIAVGESFTVTVTERDWDGIPCISDQCAVANASKRAMSLDFVSIGPTMAHFRFGYTRIDARHDANGILNAFDTGQPFPGPMTVTFTRES